MSETQEVFLYSPGVEVLEITTVDAQSVDVRIAVAQDCRIGEHLAQLRTSRGISDFRSFYVGNMPHSNENEPNNSIRDCQKIEMNRSVLGTIDAEDVDVFEVTCSSGQRLNIEITAIRLGALFDSYIAVLDGNNVELAVSDDSNFSAQDGVISLTVPESGNYYVHVREAAYGGNANCRYCLHIGEFPRPTIAYPAGGLAGSQVEIEFHGDAGGPLRQTMDLPSKPNRNVSNRPGLMVDDTDGETPSPVAFRVSDLPNVMEIEPNEKRVKVETAQALPAAFNGIVSHEKDYDYFRFTVQKNVKYEAECFAHRIGSGLDPVIHVFDAKGKRIVGDDDARRPDCWCQFTATADGDHYLRVGDHRKRGQDDFVYRVEIKKVDPRLAITIPRIDRYSQLRQQICVPRGNRFATLINVTRNNTAGDLVLADADWPDGISSASKPMPANMSLMPVVFEADANAELSGQLVDLAMRHVDPQKDAVSDFAIKSDFALGPPNNSLYYSASVNKLACAVTKSVPFKIDIIQPTVPLVRDGMMSLQIVATRDEGFDKEIVVQFPFRPPGLGTKPQVKIKKGETQASYPLNANANAQMGVWPVYAIGQSSVDGVVWVSSQLAELEIAEPFVKAEVNRLTLERGSSAAVYCKLKQLKPFEGNAKAQILGLPPHIEIPELEFTSETEELSFPVRTSEKTPLGKHKGLFLRVSISQNDETMVSTAGRSQLHIIPEVDSKGGEAAADKQKTKSRLQQLREQRQKSTRGRRP